MASSIETTSTTTTLKNNGNTYATVDTNDDVTITNDLVVSGDVGIGTTAPALPLEVECTARGIATSGTTPVGALRIGSPDNNIVLDTGITTGNYCYIQGTDKANLATGTNLLINPNGGNVGIGTTAPDQKLHLAHAGRLGLRVEATTTDIAEVLLKNTTETWGIKNEGGNLVIADESTGIMATMAKDTGVLTLAAPLPVASGGTGATSNAGKVLQVVSATLDTRVSMATTSWQDIGLSAAITPSATSSKILITVSFGRAQTTQTNGDHGAAIRLLRGSVDSDLNGIADGSRSRALFTVGGRSFNGDHSMGGYGMTGLDSPSTASAVTYKLQAWPQSGSYPLIINGTNNNTNANQAYTARTKTIITLMEIGG